jgi:hypothetical protein
MFVVLLNDGVEVSFNIVDPAFGGAGDSWFNITTDGGDVFDEVRFVGAGFAGPLTIMGQASWNVVPAPGASRCWGWAVSPRAVAAAPDTRVCSQRFPAFLSHRPRRPRRGVSASHATLAHRPHRSTRATRKARPTHDNLPLRHDRPAARLAGSASAQSIHYFTPTTTPPTSPRTAPSSAATSSAPSRPSAGPRTPARSCWARPPSPCSAPAPARPTSPYDGTRISATILTEDSLFATQGIWTEGEGWIRAFPPLAPGGAPIDNSIASAWGLSGDGSTVTGFYWSSNATGPFGGAQPCAWSMADGVTVLERDEGRNARVNDANFDGTVFCGWEENTFGQWQPTVWRDGVKIRLSENDAFVGAEKLTADGDTVVGNSLNPLTLNREPTDLDLERRVLRPAAPRRSARHARDQWVGNRHSA